jgi:hypothetical protein
MSESLAMWTVYDHPRDHPDHFVARLAFVSGTGGLVMTETTITAATLEQLRGLLPPGLCRIARHPDDDANIVEIWL